MFVYLCVHTFILDLFTTTVRRLACYKHWPSPHDHPSRPLLDAIRLNRSRRKPCPSVNSQNVAISLVIRYYRCRDLETCLMLNQKS